MHCPTCNASSKKFGRTSDGRQKYRCTPCKRILTERKERPTVEIRIPREKALLILQLLCEGASLRAIERLTGCDKKTSTRLLTLVGAGCERLMSTMIQGVAVEDVEIDEVWSYIRCKQGTKERRKISDPAAGDAYTFIGIERSTKIVLAFQLGRRSSFDAHDFMAKLAKATAGEFQLSSDGFNAYPDAVEFNLGTRVTYGQVIKEFAAVTGAEGRRYAPPRLIGQEKVAVLGNPDEEKIGTSRIERANWTLRTHLRRMTRLSNGFSRKNENHAGESGVVLLLLQFLQAAPLDPHDARDGSQRHQGALEHGGAVRGGGSVEEDGRESRARPMPASALGRSREFPG